MDSGIICRSNFKIAFLGLVSLISLDVSADVSGLRPEEAALLKIKNGGAIQNVGENPFGEDYFPKTGQLNFRQVDILLKGTGPDIEIARVFNAADKYDAGNTIRDSFADWELDIPRITTIVPSDRNTLGRGGFNDVGSHGRWRVPGNNPTAVCSNFGKPVDAPAHEYQAFPFMLKAEDWWGGAQLKAEGQSKELLKSVENKVTGGEKVQLTTKDGWSVSCLPNTANGEPGEAFLVVSPEGTKYWLNWLDFHIAQSSQLPNRTTDYYVEQGPRLERDQALYLPSRIEDKFGNYLTFGYEAKKLKFIESSDGRRVNISWVAADSAAVHGRWAKTPLIDKVSVVSPGVPEKVWTYSYQIISKPATNVQRNLIFQKYFLTSVLLPDGRTWDISMHPVQNLNYNSTNGGATSCRSGENNNFPGGLTARIKHPSGLVATYNYGRSWFMRAKQSEHCIWTATDIVELTDYLPNPYWLVTLQSKSYSDSTVGTNLITSYSYVGSGGININSDERYASPTVATSITNPSGEVENYTYSNTWGETEGDLLTYEKKTNAASPPVRVESYTYAPSTQGPYAPRKGVYPMSWSTINVNQMERTRPLQVKITQQEGVTYTWKADIFNAYGLPASTSRSNSIAGAIALRERIDYFNNEGKWVIGQPISRTNIDTGEVIYNDVVSPSDGSLLERYHFGLLKMRYTWSPQGQLTSFTDGNNNITRLSNYKLGVPQKVDYPDGTSYSTTVNGFGEIISVTDQVGAVRNYAYNTSGWLVSETQPAGDINQWLSTNYSYDYVNGALKSTKTTGGLAEETRYDAWLRPIATSRVTAGVAITKSTQYDWKGRVVFSSYPGYVSGTDFKTLTTGTRSYYDALDRKFKVEQDSEVGKLTSSTAFMTGLQTVSTDPRGNSKTTYYQALDTPEYNYPVVVQWTGVKQSIKRDVYGNPSTVTQEGTYDGGMQSLVKEYYYDQHKRLCRSFEPESGSTVRYFDGAGNAIWAAYGQQLSGAGCQFEIPSNQKINSSYDSMNRLVSTTYGDGTPEVKVAYDALGNVKLASAGGSSWGYDRNIRGLVINETLTVNGAAKKLSYTYNDYGVLSGITYPNGVSVQYGPDALGRPTMVGSLVNQIAYYPNGEVKSFAYGNGIKYSATQNARQMADGFTYFGASGTHFNEALTYDQNANLVKVVDGALEGKRSKSMTYDALDRLSGVMAPGVWGNESYEYDALNNLRKVTSGGVTKAYQYSPTNLLSSVTTNGQPGQPFEYDQRGNIVSKSGNALPFNMANQLQRYMGLEAYSYDAFGNRVLKNDIATGANTIYGYSQGRLLFQVDGSTGKLTNYYFLGKKLVAKEMD